VVLAPASGCSQPLTSTVAPFETSFQSMLANDGGSMT
jgi:hypothetical protein